jgi:glucokinase
MTDKRRAMALPTPGLPKARVVLAGDLGGRRIKLGLLQAARVVQGAVLAAEAHRPLSERLEAIAKSWEVLCTEGQCEVRHCVGIGLAYPSVIDVACAQIVDQFGKFEGSGGFDLRRWAKQRLGLPLAIDNDARMALAGEWRCGAGRDCQNVVMITLGTGLGVATVMEGRLLRGAHGQAGILGGHLTLRHGGRACVCGNIGCAEAEASTSVLEQVAKEQSDFSSSGLAREPFLDYAAVFRLASQGDRCALRVQTLSLEVWSALSVSLIHAYDPERLILGGGIMASREIILPFVRKYVERHAHTPWGKVKVVASELGDQAALIGCEALVLNQVDATG